ncbi:MAG: LysM peptidoglycan-binding domain-containing protein [Thermodesulfobacteriota bacterium]|nr:LysM peptidoglycan-binding domain-containing protein [Thermodesulfobacteriota bacterium]
MKKFFLYFLAFSLIVTVSTGCTSGLANTGWFKFTKKTANSSDSAITDDTAGDAANQVLSSETHQAATNETTDNTNADNGVSAPCPLEVSGNEPAFDEAYDDTSPETSAQAALMQEALDEALSFCEASQEFWQKGDFDNAIQALDQAYALLLKSSTGNDAKLMQQKEDIRSLISKRILEIYASRNIVVNGDHNAIPVTINKDVQAEIDLFTKGRERDFFIESYKRSGRYRPYILKKLEEAGLPPEISWLPLIESGFKSKALSRARALGLWQFIPSTGYKFGLERNMYVDERLDPEKATQAAIEYLTAMHNIFGDWATVLAAYNCGTARVLRIIRQQQINYLDDFWDLYQRLPRETARYVPRFLATLHIIENMEKYGMADIQPDPPLAYDKIKVNRSVSLKSIANATDIPCDTLITLNPDLRHNILPNEPYELKVPKTKGDIILAKIDAISVSSPPQRQFVYHRVRRGEALSTIARRYRTTVGSIARANNIYRHNYIVAGKLLKIPLSASWVSTKTQHYSKAGSSTGKHVVRSGESLWILARRYGTTVRTIMQLNDLKGTTLRVGQVLKMPGASPPEGVKTYKVKRGDSPFTIALSHGMSLRQFLQINNLHSRSTIYPGQEVYVK